MMDLRHALLFPFFPSFNDESDGAITAFLGSEEFSSLFFFFLFTSSWIFWDNGGTVVF